MTDQSPAPLTRRQLRESAKGTTRRRAAARPRRSTGPATGRADHVAPLATAPTGPAAPQHGAVAATTAPDGTPLTRRAIREAERAACAPPFAALVRIPAPAGHRRPSAGAVAKSGILVALSGALVVTSVSGLQAGSTGLDGYALRAAADRQAVEAERAAAAARERADLAAATRLSGAAAAYATARRTEALATAEQALRTATQVSTEVQPVVGAAELERLAAAADELAALVAQAQAATPALPDVAAQRGPADGPLGAPQDAADPAAADAEPAAAVRTADERPASRAARTGAPAPEQPAATTPPTPLVAPEPPAVPVVPADPAALAAEAAVALEQVDALLEAAAGLDAVVTEVSQVAAAVVAQQEAERRAAEELARKVAAVENASNGAVPEDMLCAPAFAPDARLRCDAAQALERLNAAYRAEHGRDLKVVSSYRSYSAQVATRASRGSLAATPGTSNHGRGVAVDLGGFGSVGQFDDPDYLWMRAHAGDYGWYHPASMRPGGGGPQEPWHWEYGTE